MVALSLGRPIVLRQTPGRTRREQFVLHKFRHDARRTGGPGREFDGDDRRVTHKHPERPAA